MWWELIDNQWWFSCWSECWGAGPDLWEFGWREGGMEAMRAHNQASDFYRLCCRLIERSPTCTQWEKKWLGPPVANWGCCRRTGLGWAYIELIPIFYTLSHMRDQSSLFQSKSLLSRPPPTCTFKRGGQKQGGPEATRDPQFPQKHSLHQQVPSEAQPSYRTFLSRPFRGTALSQKNIPLENSIALKAK